MKLTALTCLLTLVVPLLAFPATSTKENVPTQCGDPTFACQDLKSAKKCGTVKDCIHDIWASIHVPNDNDQICDICKEMVKEARDQLLSNMTQEEIKEVFEGSCKLIPVKIIAEGCIKIVDEIIPELVEMLASRMDPTMVCTVSGMCFPTTSNEFIQNQVWRILRMYLMKSNDAKCVECVTMMTDVQTFMKSESEDEVKTALLKMCSEKLPSYLCKIIEKSYFDEIYQYVLKSTPIQMCTSAGVCPQSNDIKDEQSKIQDELTCEFCEHLIEHVKDLVTTNTTMDEFKTALLNFCKATGKFSDKCTALVNNYYDTLFAYIKSLDSKGMCTLMGLCSNNERFAVPLVYVSPAFEVSKKVPFIPLKKANSNYVDLQPSVSVFPERTMSKKMFRENNDIFQPFDRIVVPFPGDEQNMECALCKAFSFYLESDLNNKEKTKQEVRKALNNVCDKWMPSFPDHCSHIMQKYSFKMLVALEKQTPFDDLCSHVRACPLEQDNSKELKVKVLPKVEGSVLCDLCKDAMNEVEEQLNDPATKQNLENLMGQVCNVVPQSLRDDCANFINQNVDALLDILQQELKPDNICPAVHLCETTRLGVSSRVKDLECDVCKDVVTAFRQKLQDPASKEIVEIFLEEGCARLPSSVSAECKKFVDENIDTLMTIIIEQLDPPKVCAILSICPNALVPEVKVQDVECDLCKEVVGKVEDMIKDEKTEDEIKAALDKVCSYLPSSIAGKCQSFVNTYTELLITLIEQEADPQTVCAALKLCTESEKEQLAEPVKSSNLKDVECELCKEVAGKVEDMLKDAKTQDEIKQALDKGCSYLPSSAAAKCQSFVNQYISLLITLVTEEVDPQMICASFKVCPDSGKKIEITPAEFAKLQDVECDLCKEVIGKAEDMLKDEKTEDEIKEALDKACSYLPTSAAAKCQNFVNQYVNLLITLLTEEVDPQMICAALKVCPDSKMKVEVTPVEAAKFKDIECELCKEVVGKLEDMLKDQKTEDEIKAALDKVCSYLPSSMATKCENFVNKYSQLLITLLTEELDADMICAAMKLCPVQDLECKGCQYALEFLRNKLMNSQTQASVKELLKQVCTYLPQSFTQNCNAYVDEYGTALLLLLAEEIKPSQMCHKAKMCANQTEIVKELSLGLDECSVCTTVVSYLDKLLEEDDVDKEITSLIERVCTVLPSDSLKKQCSTVLEAYGPYILQMIGQMADSKQICQEIDLCARSPEQVHLVGGSKCTFGPSYWCRSLAHANACKVESYCQEKVWKN